MNRIISSLGLVALVAASACDKDQNPTEPIRLPDPVLDPATGNPAPRTRVSQPGATQPIGAIKRSTSAAVEQIARARCAREEHCNNVGPDETYKTAAECEFKTRVDWQEELNAYECPGGIVDKELHECLQSIGNEDCKNTLDKLSRLAACRAGDICKAENKK